MANHSKTPRSIFFFFLLFGLAIFWEGCGGSQEGKTSVWSPVSDSDPLVTAGNTDTDRITATGSGNPGTDSSAIGIPVVGVPGSDPILVVPLDGDSDALLPVEALDPIYVPGGDEVWVSKGGGYSPSPTPTPSIEPNPTPPQDGGGGELGPLPDNGNNPLGDPDGQLPAYLVLAWELNRVYNKYGTPIDGTSQISGLEEFGMSLLSVGIENVCVKNQTRLGVSVQARIISDGSFFMQLPHTIAGDTLRLWLMNSYDCDHSNSSSALLTVSATPPSGENNLPKVQ